MPQPTKGKRLGGSAAHQKAILSNLATSLFEHGSITTTEAKARRLRPFAEKLITKAKVGDLHNRRQVLSVVRDKGVVHTLFTEIGPRYAARPGGYTRITKLGPRKGDNAPMAVIALVEEEFTPQVRSTRTATGGSTAATTSTPAAATATVTAIDTVDTDEQAATAVEVTDDVTVTVSGAATVTVTDGPVEAAEPDVEESVVEDVEPAAEDDSLAGATEAPAEAVADVPGDVDPAPEPRDDA